MTFLMPDRPAGPAPQTILVVDDDRGLLRLIEKALKRQGHTVATAASGFDAITWLGQHRADLLLLDLKLQDIEGKEFISQLEAVGRTTPFIVITGQGDERVAVDMMKRGALDYLVKDAQFLELVPAVVERTLAQIERDRRLVVAEEDVRRLEQEVLNISEQEQRRIGQDLHDGICQQLAGIELMSQVLEQALAPKSKKQSIQAGQIAAHVRETIAQTRMLAHGLCPVVLESEGLMSALQELAHATSKMFGVDCVFRCARPVHIHDNPTATHLYRIAQEAVSNALKHGKSRHIEIDLASDDDRIFLAVKDDGCGIPAEPPRTGAGLRIMQYRASMIGGSVIVQRGEIRGTTVACSVHQSTPPAKKSDR